MHVSPEPNEIENVRNLHRLNLELLFAQVYVPNADSSDDVGEDGIFPFVDLKISGFRVVVSNECISAERVFAIVNPLTKKINDWFTLVIPKKFEGSPELEKFLKMHGGIKVEIV